MPGDEDRKCMSLAIAKALEGVAKGQAPFGACVAKGGRVLSCEHNRVWERTDITAHAEVVAIREACANLRSIDLSGCDIYSTTEPCPMCFSAIHWARISKIIYGAAIGDAAAHGFNELALSNEELREMGQTSVEIVGGFMREEALGVFQEWSSSKGKRAY